jgi:hypothetical protein
MAQTDTSTTTLRPFKFLDLFRASSTKKENSATPSKAASDKVLAVDVVIDKRAIEQYANEVIRPLLCLLEGGLLMWQHSGKWDVMSVIGGGQP